MATRINVIIGFLAHYKYLITVIVSVLIVGFLDEDSIRKRVEYELRIGDLKKEIKKYNAKHAADAKELRDLKNDPKAIERIARTRYFMKADDEDIYVLSTDEGALKEDEDETTN